MRLSLSLSLFLLIIVSCSAKKKETKDLDGKKLFKLNCSVCHGIDGRLKAMGSKDLSLSNLTKEERVFMVRKGKGAMTAFEKVLTPEEIDAVVAYTFSLKTN